MNVFDKFSYKIKIRDKLIITFLFIAIIPLFILGITQDMLFSIDASGQFIFILILVLVLILSLILAFLAARHFDKAIQTLCTGAKELSKGNLNYRMELKSHDELEDLAVAFNTMAVQLKSSYDGLELKVKEMTFSLEDEKNKLENILMSLGEGIIVADSENHVFIINDQAEKILNIKGSDYIGKNYQDCHKNPDDIINLINMSQMRPVERHINIEDKTIKINIASIKSSIGFSGIAMIMHDITKEKELEKQKHDFISMITHDIKSPLTAILGFSSLMIRNKKDQMEDDIYKSISAIHRSATKILSLADDFLISSKLESGYYTMDMQPLKLNLILDDLISTFQSEFKDKNISLNYMIEKDLPEILGDAKEIDRVFSNIISNSIKFTSAGGKIDVISRQITDNNSKYVEILINDTGIGIPSDEIDIIFNKYSRSKITKKTKGTGLGLYIAKMIVDAHNGQILVESKVGEGASFSVRLPCN
ncbi:MAG: HAMP domain-containing protein [Candidatus Firestonebacteria bacterium]|nr:HAMP domain-containing protein [Candidatus Firestonebacteria bacterium]